MSEPLRLAYLLLVHKNPQQVNRFIRQIIDYPHADIFIHIDKKSHREIAPLILKDSHVHIIEDPVDVKWGDISQIDATLQLLRSMKLTDKRYDFALLKSGQDLMVKPGLPEYLARHPNKSFLPHIRLSEDPSATFYWGLKWPRFMRDQYDFPFHPIKIMRHIVILLYRFGWNLFPNATQRPKDWVVFWGSQWFCLSGPAADYVLDFVTSHRWYYDYFKHSLTPDGAFFQTLLMNSAFAPNVVDDNLTFLEFGNTIRTRTHARTLTLSDVREIEASGKYFARKFDEEMDSKVIDYFCNREKTPTPAAAPLSYDK